MTFLSQEGSQESGRPVELYTFTLSLSTYRFTSAEDDQVVGGNNYEAIAIRRGRVSQGQEERNATLEVEMPADRELPSRYVTGVPPERARLVIQRYHRGDPDLELATIFDGFVRSIAFAGASDARTARIAVDPALSALSRIIPRFSYRSLCNNVLYDAAQGGLCTVNPEDPAFKFTGLVSAQSGLTITVPGAGAFGANWFTGGRVELLSGLDARMIITQSGDVLTLHVAFTSPMLGQQVILRAGCDRSIQTCSDKFDRVVDFQGFAFVPTRNIFSQGLDPETC